MDWRFEMSEKEKMDAGRWQNPENFFRYLRAVADGKGAVARWFIPLEEKPEEKPEEGPADLSSEM